MKKSIHLAALMALGIPLFAAAVEVPGTILIDNHAATFGEGWTVKKPTDQFASKDRFGEDYEFANVTDKDEKKASAIYRPTIPSSGRYKVEIFYPAGDNRSAKAPWIIHYDGGEKTVLVDQKKEGGQWVELANEVNFKAGTSGYVELHNFGTPPAVVVADAVRFVPLGESAPPANAFNLTVNVGSGGQVSKNPNTQTPAQNSSVILTAKADDGYVFDGWSGAVTGFKNPIKLLMTTNKTVTANFLPAAIGVILDNPVAEFNGPWKLSQTNWGGARYEDYQFASAKLNGESTALYRPNIPKSGKYDVYVWYASGPNRSSKAPWTVYHKGGPTKATVNQQTKGGEWVPIASGVDFEAGKNPTQYVEVSNGVSDSAGSMVIADAVAFVYVGD